jgi:hypothetical protein
MKREFKTEMTILTLFDCLEKSKRGRQQADQNIFKKTTVSWMRRRSVDDRS